MDFVSELIGCDRDRKRLVPFVPSKTTHRADQTVINEAIKTELFFMFRTIEGLFLREGLELVKLLLRSDVYESKARMTVCGLRRARWAKRCRRGIALITTQFDEGATAKSFLPFWCSGHRQG